MKLSKASRYNKDKYKVEGFLAYRSKTFSCIPVNQEAVKYGNVHIELNS